MLPDGLRGFSLSLDGNNLVEFLILGFNFLIGTLSFAIGSASQLISGSLAKCKNNENYVYHLRLYF
jgi:uncharacterized membrane protein